MRISLKFCKSQSIRTVREKSGFPVCFFGKLNFSDPKTPTQSQLYQNNLSIRTNQSGQKSTFANQKKQNDMDYPITHARTYDNILTCNALPLNKKDPCGSFKNRKRRDSNPRGRLLHLTP